MNRAELNEAEYEAALREIAPYFDDEPEADSPEAVRFEQLMQAIQIYESRHFFLTSVSSASKRGNDPNAELPT
jgi:HTH-type transcriptional regulator / antitoxin HigA